MAPRELWMEFRAFKEKSRDAIERDLSLAWQVNALMRAKKLPTLRSLLEDRHIKRQSAKQIAGILEVMSEQYGIPLKKTIH